MLSLNPKGMTHETSVSVLGYINDDGKTIGGKDEFSCLILQRLLFID